MSFRVLNLSKEEIQQLRNSIENSDDRYTLTITTLRKLNFSQKSAQIIFNTFDQGKLGYIDTDEFLQACILLSNSTFEEKCEMMFSYYDHNKSNTLTHDEISVLMSNNMHVLIKLSESRPPTEREIQIRTNEFIQQADVDGDQEISIKEFKTYMKKNKLIQMAVLNSGVVEKQDLGTDFGADQSGLPEIDENLEFELKPPSLKRDEEKIKIKEKIESQIEMGEFDEQYVGSGDQKLATAMCKFLPPDSYKKHQGDAEPPESTLELEYIHGYRSFDTRNNLRYTADGLIVYHTAAVGVLLDKENNIQNHFVGHRDDIHCLAIDSTGTMCATGEIGPKPLVIIWSCRSMEELIRVQMPLTKGIAHVAFSQCGNFLGATDMSDDHSVAIYQIIKLTGNMIKLQEVAKGKGPKAAIMSIGFNPKADTLIATCVKEVNFFTWQGRQVHSKKGSGFGKQGADAILCQTFVGNVLFTGNQSGQIISWNGNSVSQIKEKAHEKGILSIYSNQPGLLITGSADGYVRVWQIDGFKVLKQVNEMDLKIFSLKPQAVSVCQSHGCYLVGTRSSEIIEFDENGAAKVLMRGHFDDELWGLDIHPQEPIVATFGRDNLLAIWSIENRQQLQKKKFTTGGDALAYSTNGQYLALGFLNGQIKVLNEKLEEIVTKTESQGFGVQVIKFSPNDKYMVVGTQQLQIRVFDVQNKFAALKSFTGNSSRVKFIDFSLDSNNIQTQSQAEFLYFDLENLSQNKRGLSGLKNEIWQTWTCTNGWPVTGIWPPYSDGSDINSCDRSLDGTVIATADDFSTVKLFKFPSPTPKEAPHNKYYGHSSHVTNVRFTKYKTGQQYLFSTGGNDKSIFQWKYSDSKQEQSMITTDQKSNLKTSQKIGRQIDENTLDGSRTNILSEINTIGGGEFEEEVLGEGDQILAVKPWIGALKAMTPQNFKLEKGSEKKPVISKMKLTWAHGFRSFDTTGNLKYSVDGNVIFTTAGVGVIQDINKYKQKFFNEHHNDIVAMAYHPGKNLVATGQMASLELTEKSASVNKKPIDGKFVRVFIWNGTTGEQVGVPIDKVLRGEVKWLCFTEDGQKLLAIGQGDKHTFVIVDVNTRQILCQGQLGDEIGKYAAWHEKGLEFSVSAVKRVIRVVLEESKEESKQNAKKDPKSHKYSFKKQDMLLNSNQGKDICTSVKYVLGGNLVCGTNAGTLLQFSGGQVTKRHDGHTKGSAIHCIEVGPNSFFTGGNDGIILKWTQQFTKSIYVDLNQWQIQNCAIRSMDFNFTNDKSILVGTLGASILKIISNSERPQVINQGHFKSQSKETYDEIWGCTTHPTLQIFATCGADFRVRLWSKQAMVNCSKPLQYDPTSIDWSSNGKWIAVGDRGATVTILDAITLELVDSISTQISQMKAKEIAGKYDFKTAQWIEALRFSPDGSKIAYGHHGYKTYLECITIDQQTGKIMKKPSVKSDKMLSSAINHLDWSQDGQTILLTNTGYELLGYTVSEKTLQQCTRLSSHVDTQWQTWSLNLGFPVQGIYGKITDFTTIKTIQRSKNGNIIAIGNTRSEIQLFNYPCISDSSKADLYFGHSAFVTKLAFSAKDNYLISTGGGDMTVFVWTTDICPIKENEIKDYEPNEDDLENVASTSLGKQLKAQSKLKAQQEVLEKRKKELNPNGSDDEGEFNEIQIGEGDEFLAIKPWKGQMKPPSDFKRPKKDCQNAPDIELELEWVHGYCGSQFRNNLSLMQNNNLAYFSAGVAVLYDPTSHTQKHFNLHHDDVTTIAFSPELKYFATGELGKRPSVFIIDCLTMKVEKELKIAKNSIIAIAYSPSGNRLGFVDGDEQHNIYVYDTKTWTCVGTGKNGINHVAGIAFENDDTFSISGVKNFQQFSIKNLKIKGTRGNFNEADQRINQCVYNGPDCLTGNILGDLYKWQGTTCSIVCKALHTKYIDAITVTPTHIFTGGRDCKVNILSKKYLPQFSIDGEKFQNSINSQIRAITINKNQDKLYFGTFGHEIIECPVNLKQKKVDENQIKVLIHGHYAPVTNLTNEVWGLTVYPNQEQYATVSDDATFRVWDTVSKKQISMISLEKDLNGNIIERNKGEISHSAMARAIDISKNEKYMALGMRDGKLRIYEAIPQAPFWRFTFETICKKKKVQEEWIEDLKFSPDDQYLLVSSHDNFLYLFQVTDFEKPLKIFGVSSSFITHFDWSQDSQKIRTNDGSYELLYYNIPDGIQQKGGASAYRDEPWSTQSCVLGWNVQGIWQAGYDGSDINHADRSHKPVSNQSQLIATADDRGLVSVFKYPSPLDTPAKCKVGKGHSSHVTKVRFNKSDEYIFSTGGNDKTVMQWKVKKI